MNNKPKAVSGQPKWFSLRFPIDLHYWNSTRYLMTSANLTGLNTFFLLGFQGLQDLACSDTSILEMVVLAIATPETFFEVFFIICTYICIVVAILQISSTTGRQKAFSTCSSHLSTTIFSWNETITPEFLLLGFQNLSYLKLPTFYSFLETVECFILAVMSYDRYLAICDPLHYTSLMSSRVQYHLMFWSWFVGTLTSISLAAQIYSLHYCRSNVIDHFFCDTLALMELSCSSTYIVKVEDLIIATIFPWNETLAPEFLLLGFQNLSYMKLPTFYSFLGIFFMSLAKTVECFILAVMSYDRYLAICDHLHYTSLMSSRVQYHLMFWSWFVDDIQPVNKFIALFYIVMNPLLNPMIYSLRNKEIRSSVNTYLTVCRKEREMKPM
ncbi:olfactory receptor 5P68-like [Anomaloglossus baeobatrachus]